MSTRLPLDANVLGYWGFDEANETDIAVDESAAARHLTVSNSPSVLPGRQGNAREFNGTSTVATAQDSAPFRLLGELTLIIWARMDQVNSSGSLLRTIVACDASDAGDAGNLLYGVYVDNLGAIVYEHQTGTQRVRIKTANGKVRAGQPISINLMRSDAGGMQDISFYVDNRECPIASVTIDGVPSALPVPAPTGGSNSVLKFGKSDRQSDSAWLDGWVDEVSLHNVVRPVQPYLRAAYYRASLLDNSTRLSTMGNVQSIASVEMGGGVRWWAFERDGSIYVTRENPFGFFSKEVMLTRTGANLPGGVSSPELVYDPVSDTLLVLFINSGRVFKVSANAADAAVTQQMPVSADVSNIIKAVDQTDAVRSGAGEGVRGAEGTFYPYPKTETVEFGALPSFGIAIPNNTSNRATGYSVYRNDGGMDIYLGDANAPTPGAGYWHFPLTSRVKGARYFVRGKDTTRIGPPSNFLVDNLADTDTLISIGVNGDGALPDGVGFGGGQGSTLYGSLVYQRRDALKNALNDSVDVGAGGSSMVPRVELLTYVNRGVVKGALSEPTAIDCGAGGGLTFRITGGSARQGKVVN